MPISSRFGDMACRREFCGWNAQHIGKNFVYMCVANNSRSSACRHDRPGVCIDSQSSNRPVYRTADLYTDTAKFAGHLPHRYGNSRAIWDHIVLPATRQRRHPRLYPSRSWYSIKRHRGDARLSWPSWLVTARDGIPARRRSPIAVVTGPDVR